MILKFCNLYCFGSQIILSCFCSWTIISSRFGSSACDNYDDNEIEVDNDFSDSDNDFSDNDYELDKASVFLVVVKTNTKAIRKKQT